MSGINRNWTKGNNFVAFKPEDSNGWVNVRLDTGSSWSVATCYISETSIPDAELIADAFNTANKTGLTPSELLEQRNEMKDALEAALRILEAENIFGHAKLAIKDAIANAKNIEP